MGLIRVIWCMPLLLGAPATTVGNVGAVKAEVTLIAFDDFFEAATLTHVPDHYLPLVLRVDRLIEGSEPAKYLLANYNYVKATGNEWPESLRYGKVQFTVTLTRQPECDATEEEVLTRRAIYTDGTEGREDRLRYLVSERIETHEGIVPCYSFDSTSYRMIP